ncbi:hypothetical protein K469DRAFT_269465 [Zopfia rhizophila CBS 207.26]|uniref:Uncharacterized protein n=1 Tax=Zopfia rhizophila CBS 207.26 TaxID=1314779 RepID=A0A6A6DQW9_9PEZI|nr:hypothetical protein K469DRAFT_269465 [Zopfia rhizophila CBS 207.26]
MPYVDNSAQTIIAGLTKHLSPFPPVLTHTSTTTPPDDVPDKLLTKFDTPPMISTTDTDGMTTSPTLLPKRRKRPPLVTRISLPGLEVGSEGPRSPPPTDAILSPLPAANVLHAGHTPIVPRALSPLHMQDESGESTPEMEEPLTGPLTLPAVLGDGAADRIELKVLDAELEKIAQEQGNSHHDDNASVSTSQNVERGGGGSRKGSTDVRRRSSADEVEVVDGVILKKPKMNLGAPLGQV